MKFAEQAPDSLTITPRAEASYRAYGNLGLISLKQRQWVEARRYLQVAVQLNPDDQIARRNLNLVETALRAR